MKYVLAGSVLLLLGIPAMARPLGGDRHDDVKRLQRATSVFSEIMGTPDKGIPVELLDKSECVAIVPGLKKGGLGIGGRYGKGIVTCRKGDRSWTAPSFLTIEGGSFGFQLGYTQIDIVMLIMNRHGIESLVGDKFTVGADASAAAGPVGRHAQADTDIKLNAEILTYSRAKGLFAGVALNGAVCKQDRDDNRDFYGHEISARQILIDASVPMPQEAEPLAHALSRQSPKKDE
ncbi:MAG TPA: lipid-binding SYLF domain-containing protein [Blastocatellia bacterium]|nr:lipid-binding SYLF domain-containing protein [Blastocatellia bacterium]